MSARRHHGSASPYEAEIGFARAIRVGNRVIVSGTAPVEPDGSSTKGDAGAQAQRCLAIIADALDQLGARVEHVVRTRIYLVDPADAAAVGRAHGALFGAVRPASTMIAGAVLLRPEWRVEIEAEAVIDG